MRILVDVRHYAHRHMRGAMSGVGEYTTELLRALFALDQKNTYILLSSGMRRPDLSFLLQKNVIHRHIQIPNKILNASLLLFKKPALDKLVGGEFDLCFLPNLNIGVWNLHLPIVLTVHDLSWKIFPQFYSYKMRLWHKAVQVEKLIGRATSFLVPSQATQRDLAHFFPLTKKQITVIPHGVIPIFDSKPDARDHGIVSRLKLPKRFALFVGTMEPRKNIPAILTGIRAYREATKDDLHFVLIGSYGWNTHTLQKELQAIPWVHVLGYIPSEDRPALYRAAEVCIWPSIYEGFGLPVLEAMASGTPVITSHTSSLPELTQNAAIQVDPYNPQDITEALCNLHTSFALRNQLKMAGVTRAKTFSWKQTAQQTLEVFERAKKA